MLAIRQTWHTFLFDMRNCVNTQMSYWAPGIDFPSFFLALSPSFDWNTATHSCLATLRFVQCHYIPLFLLPTSPVVSCLLMLSLRVTTVSIHNCIYLINEVAVIQSRQKFHIKINTYCLSCTQRSICSMKMHFPKLMWISNYVRTNVHNSKYTYTAWILNVTVAASHTVPREPRDKAESLPTFHHIWEAYQNWKTHIHALALETGAVTAPNDSIGCNLVRIHIFGFRKVYHVNRRQSKCVAFPQFVCTHMISLCDVQNQISIDK